MTRLSKLRKTFNLSFYSWYNSKVLLILLTGLIITGCKFHSIFEKSADIPQSRWSKNLKINFEVPVTDTLNGYNILISLRNNNEYPYSNCYLYVNTISPKGINIHDTVEFTLADDNGKWLGHGFGGVWSTEFYKKNIRFPVKGVYKIEVVHAMRDEPLNGIMDVSMRIEKVK